jgi:hypothetical protein
MDFPIWTKGHIPTAYFGSLPTRNRAAQDRPRRAWGYGGLPRPVGRPQSGVLGREYRLLKLASTLPFAGCASSIANLPAGGVANPARSFLRSIGMTSKELGPDSPQTISIRGAAIRSWVAARLYRSRWLADRRPGRHPGRCRELGFAED